MVCKSCNFENKEGAAFCASCGKPLEAASGADENVQSKEVPETNVTEAEDRTVLIDSAFSEQEKKEDKKDDSEADTTILTGGMNMAAPGAAPMGFNNGPAPMGNPAPMGPGFNNNAPKPMMGAPMGGQPPKGPNPPKAQKAPKAAKPPKASKSGKMGTGTKAYIVISIILMLAMAGGMVYGYMHFSGKLDDAKKENETLVADNESVVSGYESQLSEKDTKIAELEASVTDSESKIADYESQIAGYEESNSVYSAYDALIDFADSSKGQGYSDFMCSDTVLHLTGGEVAVKVYYPAQEGTVSFNCANSSVATCEWGEGWEDDRVATLYVSPVGSGNTIITLTNDQNDETIKIYVYVD